MTSKYNLSLKQCKCNKGAEQTHLRVKSIQPEAHKQINFQYRNSSNIKEVTALLSGVAFSTNFIKNFLFFYNILCLGLPHEESVL